MLQILGLLPSVRGGGILTQAGTSGLGPWHLRKEFLRFFEAKPCYKVLRLRRFAPYDRVFGASSSSGSCRLANFVASTNQVSQHVACAIIDGQDNAGLMWAEQIRRKGCHHLWRLHRQKPSWSWTPLELRNRSDTARDEWLFVRVTATSQRLPLSHSPNRISAVDVRTCVCVFCCTWIMHLCSQKHFCALVRVHAWMSEAVAVRHDKRMCACYVPIWGTWRTSWNICLSAYEFKCTLTESLCNICREMLATCAHTLASRSCIHGRKTAIFCWFDHQLVQNSWKYRSWVISHMFPYNIFFSS